MRDIKTWHQRAMAHPDHQSGMISEDMIRARMCEEIDDLRAEIERLRAAATSAGAALAAAIELLERGREDAPSKRMFSQMLADYRVIVARTRKALEGEP